MTANYRAYHMTVGKLLHPDSDDDDVAISEVEADVRSTAADVRLTVAAIAACQHWGRVDGES